MFSSHFQAKGNGPALATRPLQVKWPDKWVAIWIIWVTANKRELWEVWSTLKHVTFKMLSGFTSAVVNNTFTITLQTNPKFSQALLLVRDPWGAEERDKQEGRNSTNYTAFWLGAICAASATKTPIVPPPATLCVLIIKHQHLAVVVNLSQR